MVEDPLAARRAALTDRQRAALSARLRGDRRPATTDGIAPRPAERTDLPLSFAQQRLWFLDQLAPGNTFYNIPMSLPLGARVDVRALERALTEIVARHEILRTTYAAVGDEPIQVIHPPGLVSLPVVDLSSIAQEARSEEAARLASEEARTPFDLRAGPIFRARFLALDERSSVLVLTIHHIAADGWSMGVLLRELSALYAAFAAGGPAPLPPLRIQYADFALWQRTWLSGATLEDQLAYWRGQLRELPVLAMPLDRPRPRVSRFVGAWLPVRVPPAETDPLRRLARANDCTLFMVLLTAFVTVLHRTTGQTDIVVGAPIANRNHSQLEPLIGFFVNSLVLRIDLAGNPRFEESLRRVRAVTLGAYAHQDLPFEKLVEELRPDRDLSRNPLTQVTFQLENTPKAGGKLPDEEEIIDVKRGTAILDLAFSLWETRSGLVGGIEYSTEIFLPATIEDFVRHFRVVLRAVAADPGQPLSELPLLEEEERKGIIALGAGPKRSWPLDRPLHHLLRARALEIPGAPAILADGLRLSFAELWERVDALHVALRARGVGPEDRVGICAQRGVAQVVAVLATLQVGAAYVPLDPELPTRRLAVLVEEACPRLVLLGDDVQWSLEAVRGVPIDGHPAATEPPSPAEVSPEAPAYVLYTSGSTGRPKGVVIPHRALVNHMAWMLATFPLAAGDRVLRRTPFHFDASVWEFFAPLLAGCPMVVLPPQPLADTHGLLQAIERDRVTVVQMVPSLLELLLGEPEIAGNRSLRRVFCGGEALTPSLQMKFFRLVDAQLINLYGPTETTIDATFHVCRSDDTSDTVPIGRPIDNVVAYVLDEDLRIVPIGVTGELWLGGACVGLGYLGRPDLTRERFRPSPFEPGERLYATGDRVRWRRDGTLAFSGRADHQVKLRGFRIELPEIEMHLRQHPDIDSAVVLRLGEERDQRLAAYVVPHASVGTGAEADAAHVATWEEVYGGVYGGPAEAEDPTLDLVGWNDSATGEPIPPSEMHRWVQGTVARILDLQPRRVLEIGSGTGMLLFRVAPACQRYLAVDLSPESVARLQRTLARHPRPMAEVARCAAHELAGLPAESFDTVVINSVAQYFPSIDYLDAVVAHALSRLEPGGSIFVGDVRSLPLLDAFYLDLELRTQPDDAPTHDLGAAVERRRRGEKELVIDPDYFRTLPLRYPDLLGAWILPKHDHGHNELTRFRYDVILRKKPGATGEDVSWIEGRDGEAALLRAREVTERVGPLGLYGVPNGRVLGELDALRLLREGAAPTPVRALRAHVESVAEAACEPERLLPPGWRAELFWLRAAADGAFDVLLVPPGQHVPLPHVGELVPTTRPLRAWATAPAQTELSRRLAPSLRAFLSERLPEYMVPAHITVLDALPLTANGKLDRTRLPDPNIGPARQGAGYVPPRTPLEEVLAVVWGEILGVRVGVDDHFFADLGGHSLLATRLWGRLRELLHCEFPLRTIFEEPSVARLVGALGRDETERQRIAHRAELLLHLERQPRTHEPINGVTR